MLKSGEVGMGRPEEEESVDRRQERHDVGRPNDVGYPMRAIRTRVLLRAQLQAGSLWLAARYRNIDDSPNKKSLLKQKEEGQSRSSMTWR